MPPPPTDYELLEALLSRFGDLLTDTQREAFEGMRGRASKLTPRQSKWVRGVAERYGIAVAPSENIFSDLNEKEQREHLAHAVKIVLPWERDGYVKALKPPGRK